MVHSARNQELAVTLCGGHLRERWCDTHGSHPAKGQTGEAGLVCVKRSCPTSVRAEFWPAAAMHCRHSHSQLAQRAPE